MIYGYAKVSANVQNSSLQIKELEEFGCDCIFKEKRTGRNFNSREVYREMRAKMQLGDILVAHNLSHFGRNNQEIQNEWKLLMDDEIDVVLLDMPIIDTRKYKECEGVGKYVSELVFSLLSWQVEEEIERSRIAQRRGIEIAKKEGKFRGGKKRYHAGATGRDKVVYDRVVELLQQDKSVMDIHREVGIARNTIYDIRKQINEG